MKYLVVALLTLVTVPSWAYLTSDWDVSLGTSSLNYSYGDLSDSLDSATTVEVNYSINSSAMNSAFTVSFTEMMGSGGQQIPYTRISFGGRYYFLGLNGQKLILDSRADARVWRPTPFAGINLGMSNLSVEGFNATFMDYTLRGGVEIPLASDTLLIGQVVFGGSLSSSGEVGEEVAYSNFTLLAGLRFTSF
ncbi:hypothetical protein [Bdellovibrio bacteriovorus]|uniref:Outer membrane protein beta-barrel domain-containing protein n=1 Tax=Bdellovibrio bacteriovorus TaxID=959 RepID=A0A1Z3NC40_BDEBC|nr:hypothetical protein [Bdellovibrio bacteriovorus]ASD65028.1 hypothetical protein B9G79_16360 [Bdellovibrio bacteriovorus]